MQQEPRLVVCCWPGVCSFNNCSTVAHSPLFSTELSAMYCSIPTPWRKISWSPMALIWLTMALHMAGCSSCDPVDNGPVEAIAPRILLTETGFVRHTSGPPRTTPFYPQYFRPRAPSAMPHPLGRISIESRVLVHTP